MTKDKHISKRSVSMLGNTNAKGKRSAEARANVKAGAERIWQDPEHRAKMNAALNNPAVNAKKAAAKMGNTHAKGKRSAEAIANIKAGRRRAFIARCFDGGIYNWS